MKYKKIKDLIQYNQYCKRHEQLLQTDFKKDQDEIELLEILIEEYDVRTRKSIYQDLNPVELLRTLLQNANLSQVEFSRQLGVSRQLINDILKYRRNISKELVAKLTAFFSMSQEAFSRAYDLDQKTSQARKKKRQAKAPIENTDRFS